jgi:hypothetical protein
MTKILLHLPWTSLWTSILFKPTWSLWTWATIRATGSTLRRSSGTPGATWTPRTTWAWKHVSTGTILINKTISNIGKIFTLYLIFFPSQTKTDSTHVQQTYLCSYFKIYLGMRFLYRKRPSMYIYGNFLMTLGVKSVTRDIT